MAETAVAEHWEYWTRFLHADAGQQREYLRQIYRKDPPKHAPQAMVPALDEYGEMGWELAHMQPVYVGRNDDVLVHSGNMGDPDKWSAWYFCVFKRRKSP